MSQDQLQALFWAAFALTAYTYALYPLSVAALACLKRRPAEKPSPEGSISIVLTVFNEAGSIWRRLNELSRGLDSCRQSGEILVVSDGSTDETVAIARSFPDARVRVLALPSNVGKAAALSEGYGHAQGDILVFADARQRWTPDVLPRLVAPFSDPRVGGVGGELTIEPSAGVLQGVGMYWRYEKWLRRNESRLHSTVGVSGSISAVRRELFRPIPRGTILDDVYWPLQVVMQGFRVVHAESAVAFDRLPPRTRDEFRRKVRTLSGNFQLLQVLPRAILPWRNPIWVQFVSHKLMRLLVPWALLAMLIASAVLGGPLYGSLFIAQAIGYVLATLGLVIQRGPASRALAPLGSFVILNAAAWCAFWVWVFGGTSRTWSKVSYQGIQDS